MATPRIETTATSKVTTETNAAENGTFVTTGSNSTSGVNMYDYTNFRVALEMYPICTFALVVMGTIGNIISFFVLSRKGMRMTSSSVYLRALAASDTGCLWLQTVAMVAQVYPEAAIIVNAWFCRWFFFSVSSVSAISTWLVVAMTIERFIVVTFPLRAASLVSVRKSLVVVAVICGLGVLTGIYTWWTATAVGPLCRYDSEKYATFLGHWNIFESCISQFIPVLMVLVLNCLIITQMYRARRAKKSLSAGRKETGDVQKDQASQIASMLLAISITFFIFTVPSAMYTASVEYWVNWDDPELYSLAALFSILSIVFLLLNYSTNFIVYCLAGSKFRAELKAMIICSHSPGGSSMNTTTTTVTSPQTRNDPANKLEAGECCAVQPDQVGIIVHPTAK